MDNYQAVYDAVRSRLSNGDIGEAVQAALRNVDISHYVQQISSTIQMVAGEYERPSTVYRPTLKPDGNEWCALYGDNLQEGVAGFGSSPALAMRDFDRAWVAQLNKTT